MTAQLCHTKRIDHRDKSPPLIRRRRTSYARHADSIKIKPPKELGSDLMILNSCGVDLAYFAGIIGNRADCGHMAGQRHQPRGRCRLQGKRQAKA